MIDIMRIMKMIPHRYPLLLIDRVIEMEAGQSATGLKNVTINEPFFNGHFPGHPVMPGVLIIEAMAQTCAIVVVDAIGKDAEGKLVYFTSIENAKFRSPVRPGDSLHIKVDKLQQRKNLWKFNAVAEVDGKKVTEATIAAMIMDQA